LLFPRTASSAMSTALEQLGTYIAEKSCAATDRLLELHIIDTLGAWIASTATAEGARLLQFRAAMHKEHADATLSLDLATRCALVRLSEIDDIHLPSMTTPGGIVVPAAVSMAGALRKPAADDVFAAIMAGYEVMTRLGRAIDGPTALYRGIWPTYFAAPAAVAAVVARLLGVDARGAANALALALTFAAPGVSHHNAATTARWLAVGNAARNGFAAALAAQQGFTGDLKLIEGNFFPGIYGITPDIAVLTEGLGETPVLPDVSFKPWCAARQTMAATQGLKEIIAGGVVPASMTEIHAFVLSPHLKMIDHGVVAGDRASHLTSLPYCMAIAAVAPELAFDVQQSPPELPDAVRGFMSKIKIETDAGLLTDYPHRWRARVRVVADAHTHELPVTDVPGDRARAFDRSLVQRKFLRFVTPALGEEKARHILAHCDDACINGRSEQLAADVEAACRAPPPSPA
jgi:2-methylcitrate dehydratase PrpD